MELKLRYAIEEDIEKIKNLHLQHGAGALQKRTDCEFLSIINRNQLYVIADAKNNNIYTTGGLFNISEKHVLLGAYTDILYIDKGFRGEQIIGMVSMLDELSRRGFQASLKFYTKVQKRTEEGKKNLFLLAVKYNVKQVGFVECSPDETMEEHSKEFDKGLPMMFFELPLSSLAMLSERILGVKEDCFFCGSSRKGENYVVKLDVPVVRDRAFLEAVAQKTRASSGDEALLEVA